ncbi:MAG TPA: GH25 family lysozyme [Armatimonadota bacterium]|jgi:hypothetical protein
MLLNKVRLLYVALTGVIATSVAMKAAATPNSCKYEVVAQTGSGGITGIGSGVSINDSGAVAFSATTTAGNNIYVADLPPIGHPATVRNINSAFANSGRVFGNAVQINNTGWVIARDRYSGPYYLERLWNATPGQENTFTTLARGGSLFPNPDFDSVVDYPSVNNINQDVFYALTGGSTNTALATGVTPSFSTLIFPGLQTLRPMLADDGTVVLRAGNTSTSRIAIYSYSLDSPVSIGGPEQFAALGRSPGISDDGHLIAFYGDLNATGAQQLGTTAGPGIFVYSRSTDGNKLVRVATASSTGPVGSFSADDRVAVNSNGAVVYMAFDPSGKKCLFVSHVNSRTDPPWVYDPFPILHQGDSLAGLSGTVQSIDINDPINEKGLIALWVSTGSGQAVLRVAPVTEGVDISASAKKVSESTFRRFRDQYKKDFVVVQGAGNYCLNPYAKDQLEAARKAGMHTGLYVYLRFTDSPSPGASQVDRAISAAGSEAPYLSFIALDVETGKCANGQCPNNPGDRSIVLKIIEDAKQEIKVLGFTPIVYTSYYGWDLLTGSSSAYKDLDLWDVDSTKTGNDLCQSDPDAYYGAWTRYNGSQYILDTTLTGVDPDKSVKVDMDVFEARTFWSVPSPNALPEKYSIAIDINRQLAQTTDGNVAAIVTFTNVGNWFSDPFEFSQKRPSTLGGKPAQSISPRQIPSLGPGQSQDVTLVFDKSAISDPKKLSLSVHTTGCEERAETTRTMISPAP